MNKNERALFLELCRFRSSSQVKLNKLITLGAATFRVLGALFSNRMAALAYGVLRGCALLPKTDREFRNSLKNAYLQNCQRNESYFACVEMLSDILRSGRDAYALLKGAYLCRWYPEGYRTSNDIDILTESRSVTRIGRLLTEAGFCRGYIRSDVLVPAARQEIIASKMLRGETVPYIKEVNLPFMRYLEVDINFSLDYKHAEDHTVSAFLSRAAETELRGLRLTTLDRYDFLIHLCSHLYKEAAAYPWIEMKRDMTLYKFCDIYALLNGFGGQDFEILGSRALETDTADACFYALYMTKALFDIRQKDLETFLHGFAAGQENLLQLVARPAEKKTYRYLVSDPKQRFFTENRLRLLEEVRNYACTCDAQA